MEKTVIPAGFLDEETRSGYVVTADMKRVWAVQLEMVEALLDICQRHNLRIWADAGTLLGVIRHGGYIPWDDDIDMVMPREDYDRLQQIAPHELAEPLFFQTMHTDPGYTHRHAQIRNSNTAAIGLNQKSYTCNCGIFIDIFPLEYMPASPRHFKRHYNRITRLKQHIRLIQRLLLPLPRGIYMYCRNHTTCLSDERLFDQYEDLLRSVKRSDASTWVDITFNHTSPQRPIVLYEQTLWMDFEYLKMPVPVGYDAILTTHFGDYMTPVKSPSYHGTLIYDTEHSYKEILK